MNINFLGRQKAFAESPAKGSLWEYFHENTKIHPDIPGQAPGDSTTVEERRAMALAGKRFTRSPKFELPVRDSRTNPEFRTILRKRRSRRDFIDSSLQLDALSRLLWDTNGISDRVQTSDRDTIHLRTAPSAGALFPGEIYLWPRRVEGLTAGLYHYDPFVHNLSRIGTADQKEIEEACCNSPFVGQSAVTFLISAMIERTCSKYGDRGYRYALLDIGHLAQNLCLSATAEGLGVVTTCSFYDARVNKLLGLDGISESILYTAYVGQCALLAS